MAQCTILYPGLLGPDVPLEELPQSEWPANAGLPNLALLLSRAQIQAATKQSFEHQLLSALGYCLAPDGDVPVARLRQTTPSTENARMWCLDPVYVQIDRELAYLAAVDALSLSESEARQLIADINQHFADVLYVQYHHPQQWLVSTNMKLATRTPGESLLQDLTRMLPTGPDAQQWHRIVNEIQMLLHAHPVNEARVQSGKLPVNSVWLWGGGEIGKMVRSIDIVYANHALATAAASHRSIQSAALPEQIAPAMFKQQQVLLVLSEHMTAIYQKDVYAWFAALDQFEQTVLTPLIAMLKAGNLDQLVVQSDTLRMSLDKRGLGRWWRPRKSIASRILEFRKQYGG